MFSVLDFESSGARPTLTRITVLCSVGRWFQFSQAQVFVFLFEAFV